MLNKKENNMCMHSLYNRTIKLAEPVKVTRCQGAAAGTNISGENEVYIVLNGPPATFYCIDLETSEIKFQKDIPQSDVVWALTIGADRNVYFSGTNDGILYRYIPHLQAIESLGKNPCDNWVWELRSGNDPEVFGCTYPGCKIFGYDAERKRFNDYGAVVAGEQYARTLAVIDKYIYAGTGSRKHLVRIHRDTNEKEEIKLHVTGDDGFIYNLFAYNQKIFIQLDAEGWIVMDEATCTIEASLPSSVTLSPPSPLNPVLIYFIHAGQLHTYNCHTRTVIPIDNVTDLPVIKRLHWVTLNRGKKAGKTVLVAVTEHAGYILYDPENNEYTAITPQVSPKPIALQSLEMGPDNRLYMGGYHCGFSIYDTEKNEVVNTTGLTPQAEGIGFLNGKVYIGMYPHARMFKYDPEKEFQCSKSSRSNPGMVFHIEHEQDRPFAITSGENKLFVGTIPEYGRFGGALVIYDAKKDSWSVYRNIVENQSLVGLAYRDGILYGGTSIWGGLGMEPVEKQAKMFVWDVSANKKIHEFTLDIPGNNTPLRKIGGLSFSPDGLLWGAADGCIFAVNPQSLRTVKSKVIYTDEVLPSRWRPVYLRWGKNGKLYTTLGGNITLIHPDTLDHEILVKGNIGLMVLDKDDNVYYGEGTCLMKLYRAAD